MEELCYKYYKGVDSVRCNAASNGISMKRYIDEERFQQVNMLLEIQVKEAVWWRNACLLYFQTFSKMPIPAQYEKPDQTLEYYKSIKFSLCTGKYPCPLKGT